LLDEIDYADYKLSRFYFPSLHEEAYFKLMVDASSIVSHSPCRTNLLVPVLKNFFFLLRHKIYGKISWSVCPWQAFSAESDICSLERFALDKHSSLL
jgi:hypothetical protein